MATAHTSTAATDVSSFQSGAVVAVAAVLFAAEEFVGSVVGALAHGWL